VMRADLVADGFEKWPATAGNGHHGDLYLSGDKQRHPGLGNGRGREYWIG